MASIRDALRDAAAERPSGPRPMQFHNVAIVRPDEKNSRPVFHMEFDFPRDVLTMPAAAKVCTLRPAPMILKLCRVAVLRPGASWWLHPCNEQAQ